MSEIKLFGVSTEAGKYLKKEYKKYLNQTKLVSFSRSSNSGIYFDLTSPSCPKELSLSEETLLISLAPIWLFVPFLKSYIKLINREKVKGIIITSSTSINTKKYTWNKFDKKLYSELSYWEESVKEVPQEVP